MSIDSKDIKPSVKYESDKYSWNLYRFIKNVDCDKVIVDIKGWEENTGEQFDIKRIKEAGYLGISNVYIVRSNTIESGRSLKSIVNDTKPLYQTFWHYWLTDDNVLDITEIFWKEYKRRGRCLLFEHDRWLLRGDNNRFVKINSHSRKCKWCGEVHTRRIETIKRIERIDVWE